MKILTINTQKGGTGKTTTTDNFSDYLSNFGSVLVVDADPSGNTTRFFTSNFQTGEGLEILPENELAGVFRNLPVSPIQIKPNLDLIAGSSELYEVIQELSVKNKGLTTFRNWVRRAKLKDVYDYIVIDTHNDESVITKAMLLTADMVLSVIEADQFAIDGYVELKSIITKLQSDIDLVDDNDNPYMTDNVYYIVNKVNMSESASKAILETVTSGNDNDYLGFFHERTIFNKASLTNRTVIDMANTSDYKRTRYLPFFENVKKTMDNIKEALDKA